MRDPIILLVHLIATLARLLGPGGLRSVVAESLLVKQQLLILNRSRHRAPNLRPSDRILAGVCALFMRPARVLRSAIVLRPSTILAFHRTLRACKYRWLFAPRRRRTGPKGPSPVPTEPGANDVRIWEHCEVPGVVTGWEVSARKGFPMKQYDTEEEAYKAARMFGQLHKRDVWVTRIEEVHTTHRTGGNPSTTHVVWILGRLRPRMWKCSRP